MSSRNTERALPAGFLDIVQPDASVISAAQKVSAISRKAEIVNPTGVFLVASQSVFMLKLKQLHDTGFLASNEQLAIRTVTDSSAKILELE